MGKIIIAVILCFSLSGCVMFIGDKKPWGAIGFGKRTIEYDNEGKIKKEIIESKSLLENIVNIGGKINQ